MIRYYDGSIFHLDIKTRVNTVNCDGFMGAGIALEFKLRYPKYFSNYQKKAQNGEIKVGKVDYYADENNLIISFPTKNHFKYPSKLEWIESGLIHFVETYEEMNIKEVSFPKLGTSNGGLKWEEVKIIMEKHLNPLPIDVFICLDKEIDPFSDEYKMIQFINHIDYEDIIDTYRLTVNQANNLINSLPIKRFRDLLKIKSIGEKTYAKLYKNIKSSVVEVKQTQNLFDL